MPPEAKKKRTKLIKRNPEISEETPVFHSGFVVVLGRPNAGKSTLVNLLAGHKVSIVTPRPQTTRNRILAMVNRPHAQLILVDTPGVASRKHKLDDYLIDEANAAAHDADAAIIIVDARSMHHGDLDWALLQASDMEPRPVMLLINKLDLMPMGWHTTPAAQIPHLPQNVTMQYFSALRGAFSEDIVNWCIARLPEGPQYFPSEIATDHPDEWQAAELVREQVMLALRQEVPYAAAIIVEEFEHGEDGKLTIRARVLVERESQKPIVIGEGARKIKSIGMAARQEISRIMGVSVELFLTVAVLPDWRDDARSLAKLGFRNE